MTAKLKVIKADRTEEDYFHTKVLGCLLNGFGCDTPDYAQICQELAETATFYLYKNYGREKISSSEIFSVILAVLSSTGFDYAAENLSSHRQKRELLRSRLEVVDFDEKTEKCRCLGLWNKSEIIRYAAEKYNLDNIIARMAASAVEEKILAANIRTVTGSFIKFLTLFQIRSILSADERLDSFVAENKKTVRDISATDCRIRRSKNGLCAVEA